MTFLKVRWIHTLPTEPVEIYSELDGDRWEKRKVEIFADGSLAWADATTMHGGTRVAEEALPTNERIASDPQFAPVEISEEEFEKVWKRALAA